jgi:hypothetical protein
MKVLTTATELKATMCRLMDRYRWYRWAVAWASAEFPLYRDLLRRRRHISQIIVGTHFYQTHPEFLEALAGHEGVRFVLQTDGVFHPKVYLFENSPHDWACIVGSPNFTRAAFSQNTELAMLVDSDLPDADQSYQAICAMLLRCWEKASSITEDQIEVYRTLWKRGHARLRKLSGQYGKRSNRKLSVDIPLLGMHWDVFVSRVRAEQNHRLCDRLDILSAARTLFRSVRRFADMELDDRRRIGGYAPMEVHDWGLFGSMRPARQFKSVITSNNGYISDALDCIPLDGMVTRDEFNDYIKVFRGAFPNGGGGIAGATRLLCMKRPDMFVCLDRKNQAALRREFGSPKGNMTCERYWDEIIDRVREADWWNSPRPSDQERQAIWRGRTALLDGLYYDPEAK